MSLKHNNTGICMRKPAMTGEAQRIFLRACDITPTSIVALAETSTKHKADSLI